MADNKILYDIDFNVHTDSISQGVAKAVAAGLGDIDKAIEDLALRKGRPHLYQKIQEGLDFSTVLPISAFADLAASPKYNYTPSTIQTMIRHSADVAMKGYEDRVDMDYKLDMESAINKLRAIQNQVKKSSLAQEYQQQGQMFYDLAQAASTPEEKRIFLGRAASRYGSIAARTLIESGAVSPEAAMAALSNSATLGAMRSGIMTDDQIAAYNARIWKNSPNVTEPKAEAAFAATKASQEDLAWASRSSGYDERRKAREMEMGFRAMEASSATEELYNVNNDPDVARYNILSSIDSAKRYANLASTYEEGTPARRASIMLAKESLRGININAMANAGMSREEIAKNTTALVELTDTLKRLSGGGGGGGDEGPSFFENMQSNAIIGGKIGKYMATGATIAQDIMMTRTSWLANTKTPYEERQESILKKTQQYASEGIVPAAMVGAAVGGAVGGPIGMVGGALIGGGTAVYTALKATHKLDEKHISDAYRQRAIDMNTYFTLYGNRADYNYAQVAGETGYTSMESVLGLTQTADMFPGAVAFGGASEQQMMALSYFPNYWKGINEGASTSELLERYRYDAERLPRMYRQYLTSLLPGMNEELRAYAMSDAFGQVNANKELYKAYDINQQRYIPDLERTQVWRAAQNARKVNEYMDEQIPELDYPDIIRSTDNGWTTGDIRTVQYSSMSGKKASAWDNGASDIIAEGITKAFQIMSNPLMAINLVVDGMTTTHNVGFNNWGEQNQSLTLAR